MHNPFTIPGDKLTLYTVSIAAVMISGCTTPQSQPEQASSSSQSSPVAEAMPSVKPWKKGDPVPNFTGPWRDSFLSNYKESTSDQQRTILADGKVTEQEYSQLFDTFGKCLKRHGFTNFSYSLDGTYSVKPPAGMQDKSIDKLHDTCDKNTLGTIDMLFTNLRTNPQNEEITELMAACLVRSKLAPAGYSGADYYRDAPDNFPFDDNDDRFGECVRDPKGILGK